LEMENGTPVSVAGYMKGAGDDVFA